MGAERVAGIQTPEPELNFCPQFTLASSVYFTLSKLFPARETILDHAILDREETISEDASSGDDNEKKDSGLVDVVKVA